LPVPRWPSAGSGGLAPCACKLLARDRTGAIRTGAPRRSQAAAPPSPQHGSRVRYPRAAERSSTRGTGPLNTPHPETLIRPIRQDLGDGEGGGENRPAGRLSHLACACGYRAGVSRWGVVGAVSCEQRGALLRDVPARSHAQAGRRDALDARPERRLPARGAKQEPHAVKQSESDPQGKERASTQ
jgi:hypothetical protein